VQYKLQKRMLRMAHPHEHYGNALLKYARSFAVRHRNLCVMVSADDKARVCLGEPGCPAQTGVRNRPQLALADQELHAGGWLSLLLISCSFFLPLQQLPFTSVQQCCLLSPWLVKQSCVYGLFVHSTHYLLSD
jgi:hypothetical protein